MLNKLGRFFLLYFLFIATSFAQTYKEEIDEGYHKNLMYMKKRLSSRCIEALSPVFDSIEASHQLFLNDKPLDAVLKNVELLHDILPSYKNLGCYLAEIPHYIIIPSYMWYHIYLTNQFEKMPPHPTPTDFEKIQLINVANSISIKVSAMCQVVSCDRYAERIIEFSEGISQLMLEDNPDYFKILKFVNSIKQAISQACYFRAVKNKRYLRIPVKMNTDSG